MSLSRDMMASPQPYVGSSTWRISPSVVVYKDGAYLRAKSGVDGSHMYVEDTVPAILGDVFPNMAANGGGLCVIKRALYPTALSTTTIPDNVMVRGEGAGNTILRATNGISLFKLSGIATKVSTSDVAVMDLEVRGQGISDGSTAFKFDGLQASALRNVRGYNIQKLIECNADIGGVGVGVYGNQFMNIKAFSVQNAINLLGNHLTALSNINQMINVECINSGKPVGSRAIAIQGGENLVLGGRMEGNAMGIQFLDAGNAGGNLVQGGYLDNTTDIQFDSGAEYNFVQSTLPVPLAVTDNSVNKTNRILNLVSATLKARHLADDVPVPKLSTGVFGTAGRVYLARVVVPYKCEVDGISYQVGGASAGNVRAGLYAEGATPDIPDAGVLKAESASTAMGAVNTMQFVPFSAAVVLDPGLYYMGLQADATAIAGAASFNVHYEAGVGGACRYYDRVGGYGAFTTPCPATTAVDYTLVGYLRVKRNIW
ncbi:MAG: hypothetical protein M1503_11495 [Thaumarchaeota archaeon]|nr:hypothetical protein [Nitrososphaerota archaeon]MCL5318867.1 hypothetical protein [Nitrososphaerota archaeon]